MSPPVDPRLARWEARLQSLTTQSLTTDYVRSDPPRIVEAVHSVALPESTRLALLQLSILDGFNAYPQFTVLLAALVVLSFRLTGDEDISLGTSSEKNVPFVLRTPVTAQTTFHALLSTVKQLESEGAADSVPFADLVAHLQAKSKTAQPPALFRQSIYHAPDAPDQEFLSSRALAEDLTIYVELAAGSPSQSLRSAMMPEITLRCHYNQLLFSSARVLHMVDQLLQIVQIAAKSPEIPVGSISLITPTQKAILPDPTKALDWSNFRGAIHDIFSANAKKHPERECVIETPDFSCMEGNTRAFTYQQIDEASNILAHHFVQKGVKPGDVVMVYAHRGVDLVVAVMGVLKAGATFSVIDPAYPPARQNIYLQVAQPRALVVIAKAGKLAPLVRNYIAKELSIVTEVPALAIQADGTLFGGALTEKDVLAEQVSLKAQGTGIIVGPDSNPTLSFTSGSEGIPKGVRGRHFSLTYYFPWMASTFGLSSSDRFTMLSGIAHDPIQRDIFTPLFLGAKLLVPTADDIGTPGRLAEWMDEHGATITHLTPAMGQLLSAQATRSIPSLHHAFFVGDILTKRDCLRLQTLARNVAIVNMYGTTETQRAVSYFEVPSLNTEPTFCQTQKDVIAAGRGMLNVQLLVVNRHDTTQVCGVGEIGEIYVRAAGLAEGYLQLPEMTATKFLKNWFVSEDHWNKTDTTANESWRSKYFGPRDRMYRTGDLGRYTPAGDVECSGRADDQVKIRGFRIELGEIDTHLSQHPLVRENCTLVRRDKDEEPVLISYIVPLENAAELNDLMSAEETVEEEEEGVKKGDEIVRGLRKYGRLIKNIKEYLKKKLPSYAVPTVVVPLRKLPLNPNGKIDKPALPFPDTAQLAAAARRRPRRHLPHADGTSTPAPEGDAVTLTPIQTELREIWQSLLTLTSSPIELADNFFDLGGHSILATRMIFEVRKKFVVDVALGAIFNHPTLGALAAEIERLRGSGELSIQGIGANGASATAGTATPMPKVTASGESEYAADARELVESQLPKAYPSATTRLTHLRNHGGATVLLTGATGFLGAYILRDLLNRTSPSVAKVLVHVRAKDAATALSRVINSCLAYGVWNPAWLPRLVGVAGELGGPQIGVDDATWKMMADTVDVVIHNGALVHWVYPYRHLRPANVLGTLTLLGLCAANKEKPKSFAFVSSTSVLDTQHYVTLSDTILSAGGAGVPESDSLEGSATGLETGYGQSKWAGEYLVRKAGEAGLSGCVIRPGYVTGDSTSGVANTDDFLLRMVKGCVQLGMIPAINNTVNMVPVDHVARVVVACAFSPPGPTGSASAVAHVTSHPRLRFMRWLLMLRRYGYRVSVEDYIPWRIALEKHITANPGGEGGEENALFPLLHFVLDNLPQSTKAPELEDGNAVRALLEDGKWTKEERSAGAGVGEGVMGVYLAYLVEVGFLPGPVEVEKGVGEYGRLELPHVRLLDNQKAALGKVGGRGAA